MAKHAKKIPEHAKLVFKGIMFEVWHWKQKMFDGSIETFEGLRRDNASQVIAVVGDKILVQKQEQIGVSGIFASIPGGRLENGEDPLEGVKRELLEEAGYVSNEWNLWRVFEPSHKIDWQIYTYIARNCEKKEEPRPDAGEKFETKLVDFEEFLKLADDPTFRHQDLASFMVRAQFDPEYKEEFRKIIFG